MTTWKRISEEVILAIHDAQLAEHGGSAGLRDLGLLQSALACPLNLSAYGALDHADLAASYGCGIARNHPFVDGNKRTAFVAMELFLAVNGFRLDASDTESVLTMLGVAAGDIDEAAFATWIRDHARKR